MKYWLKGHESTTAVQDTLICLLPEENHPRLIDDSALGNDYLVSELVIEGDSATAVTTVCRAGKAVCESVTEPLFGDDTTRRRQCTYAIKTGVYKAVLPFLEEKPLWGSLTGVKPAKPVRLEFDGKIDVAAAHEMLEKRFFVSESRRNIAIKAAVVAQTCNDSLIARETQLYVGIPFCPAKCAYCSFVSNDMKLAGHLMEPYLRVLHDEISAAARMVSDGKLPIGSIYIGGGTPTTLNESQLEALLEHINSSFSKEHCREFTVEAGRPETINEAKLKIISQAGARRISINPQTMNDAVLRGVGRLHTGRDVVECYNLARKTGDFVINMDIIAGLPNDTEDSLFDSVRQVAALEPENITIHSMALKKGAALRFGERGKLRGEALDRCYEHLYTLGYEPYYLYRQKYIAGGLENVGFCKKGYQSHYNICMMEELSDILALGAGGVSKLCTQGGRKISRIANPKYAPEYIGAAERIICEKSVNIME